MWAGCVIIIEVPAPWSLLRTSIADHFYLSTLTQKFIKKRRGDDDNNVIVPSYKRSEQEKRKGLITN